MVWPALLHPKMEIPGARVAAARGKAGRASCIRMFTAFWPRQKLWAANAFYVRVWPMLLLQSLSIKWTNREICAIHYRPYLLWRMLCNWLLLQPKVITWAHHHSECRLVPRGPTQVPPRGVFSFYIVLLRASLDLWWIFICNWMLSRTIWYV